MENEIYIQYLKDIIQTQVNMGTNNLTDILYHCEGADPQAVFDIIKGLGLNKGRLKTELKNINENKYVSISNQDLPAPDPSLSQWWFTSLGANKILSNVFGRAIKYNDPKILCIGCPSLVKQLSSKIHTTLLDIDNDIIRTIKDAKIENLECHQYNIQEDLNKNFQGKFDISIIDPPWYDDTIKQMINRAIEATKLDGDIYCTFPGRLTRADIEKFRTDFIQEIVSIGHRIIAINHDSILYQVPPFESIAFKNIEEFIGVPWRKGDLIHIQKANQKLIPVEPIKDKIYFKSYSRKPEEFRVFLNGKANLKGRLPPQPLNGYSDNVSTKKSGVPDLWTTTKVGLRISDKTEIEHILHYWELGKSQEDTINCLIQEKGIDTDRANALVNELEKHCSLWSKYVAPKVFRSPEEISEQNKTHLSPFATQATPRIKKEDSDSFRPQYSRDRDRLIWSTSLRRLADKTQLFPSKSDDTVRRRLTHTLEVMQLASTIGTSLGLNNDLIETSALAHDIGHTPFGHAGEFAINRLFNSIDTNLGGFNHYEQGLDVVLYIESPYINRIKDSFFGLNLSLEILESIIKHTYFFFNDKEISLTELIKKSKHKDLFKGKEGHCHLEGQTVRIADKISYLISDIEDGIRLGAINILDILDCKLFHHPLLNFDKNSKNSLYSQFLDNRNNLIKILMEDAIKASTHCISQSSIDSPESVRKHKDYLIKLSDSIQADINEIWKKLQCNLLFKHKKVLSSNIFAAKIVSELVLVFTLIPSLVDKRFQSDYEKLRESDYIKAYINKVGPNITIKKEMLSFMPFHLVIGEDYPPYNDINSIPVFQLIQAKDYVCSLSDYKTRILHKEILNDTIDT